MSRRRQLEHEVSVAQERIKKAAKDTPKDILKLWEQELVDLELELNNMVDAEEESKYPLDYFGNLCSWYSWILYRYSWICRIIKERKSNG